MSGWWVGLCRPPTRLPESKEAGEEPDLLDAPGARTCQDRRQKASDGQYEARESHERQVKGAAAYEDANGA